MAIRVALNHITRYHYDRPIQMNPQVVRLRPAPHCRTPIISYSLGITPEKHFINWQQDPQSNYLARLVFLEKTDRFEMSVDLVAEMTVINPFDFFLEDSAMHWPLEYADWQLKELDPYLKRDPIGPRLREFLRGIDCRQKTPTVDFLVELNQRVQQRVEYLVRMEPGIQSPEETLKLGSGSCRDSSWLLVHVLRELGLAARFVSGFLIQLVPDVKPLEGPEGPPADFTDLHAWAEVYLPGAGWVGLDPTSGLLAGEGHIPLACTPDPASAAPLSGSHEQADVEFSFEMKITRIHEDPRVTLPYSDEQWAEIESLGHRVDEILNEEDVRLTMGGEPTFVSIDDMDGEEWNTAALGPTKRDLATDLMQRLKRRFTTGALIQEGQGKWYPGESLPRWALSLYWRKDGEPIWQDPSLFAQWKNDYQMGPDDAQRFVSELATRLQVEPDWATAGYEDVWYYLWKERRLPENLDPLDSRLDNEEDRARLAKVFEQGLDRVVGYALPIERRRSTEGLIWASGPWFFRGERMFLLPGDSPMGLRLPLDSLPWLLPEDRPWAYEADPAESLPELPPQNRLREHEDGRWRPQFRTQPQGYPTPRGTGNGYSPQHTPDHRGSGEGTLDDGTRTASYPEASVATAAGTVIRTALCVEPRGGRLHIFMPPCQVLEDYLSLIATVEETAAELQMPVVIEGYNPPRDRRLRHISVTPDPGVIEVNVHPAASWDDAVEITTGLYEDARQSRLGTEKFLIDGRHTGTGGGNHIVLGGEVPADSPFLRKPDLLRSLLTYWNNHPSLSYLFSGLFVGPTSQAPRVDEARHEALHELELAGSLIPTEGEVPPWLVDRLYRHLLTDLTGNTHRAEFCIDKLYSPDSSAGRLGLVELRAFEMPPHPRMSLTQQLLLRALIARFWKQPYQQKLVRWGTALHDRWMLPYFIRQDFADVIAGMNREGFPLKAEWFNPHLEFRYPTIGKLERQGLVIELRQAIEPWNTLGEEPGGGGTVRFVDSSVERIEVLVSNMTDPRHVVTCNGYRLPLHPTGVTGQYVAGIRYRAWQPPECLHPTIGVHAPLVLDVVDTWLNRSVGGCTYHVAHPGGRSHETSPVNSYEAEGRRVARFFAFGHTPGDMETPIELFDREFPLTLDLRRATVQ